MRATLRAIILTSVYRFVAQAIKSKWNLGPVNAFNTGEALSLISWLAIDTGTPFRNSKVEEPKESSGKTNGEVRNAINVY